MSYTPKRALLPLTDPSVLTSDQLRNNSTILVKATVGFDRASVTCANPQNYNFTGKDGLTIDTQYGTLTITGFAGLPNPCTAAQVNAFIGSRSVFSSSVSGNFVKLTPNAYNAYIQAQAYLGIGGDANDVLGYDLVKHNPIGVSLALPVLQADDAGLDVRVLVTYDSPLGFSVGIYDPNIPLGGMDNVIARGGVIRYLWSASEWYKG